jgi:hypothetical protein
MSHEPPISTAAGMRTRRNIVKMGVILASASITTAKMAHAQSVSAIATSTGASLSWWGGRCFLRGTNIETVGGERKIEDLAIGDLLPTHFGGVCPIKWIGRYPFKKSDPSKPWVKDTLPVRIARSALAPEVPHSDLYVTGEHALFIDGVLIPVRNLINGTTITRRETREYDELEYFHIKVEGHDVIYAEGAAVETLRDVDESAVNFAEYYRKYGIPKTQEPRCAPWISFGGSRGELKSRLRSAISPWFDQREQIDVIRDGLEERGIALSRQLEPSF